jgi:hypothetical protein
MWKYVKITFFLFGVWGSGIYPLTSHGQLNKLELAKSQIQPVPDLDLVMETRVIQRNKSHYVTLKVFEQNHFVMKKFDAPILQMDNIPYSKVAEVRGTLAELMVVLTEYALGGGVPVEFSVDFELYGARFMMTQKGMVNPRAELDRLNRLELAMKRQTRAEERVKTAPPEELADAKITLVKTQADVRTLKRLFTEPPMDHEIIYTHQRSMHFFQALIKGLDNSEDVLKSLNQSVIQQFNRIQGLNQQSPSN